MRQTKQHRDVEFPWLTPGMHEYRPVQCARSEGQSVGQADGSGVIKVNDRVGAQAMYDVETGYGERAAQRPENASGEDHDQYGEGAAGDCCCEQDLPRTGGTKDAAQGCS